MLEEKSFCGEAEEGQNHSAQLSSVIWLQGVSRATIDTKFAFRISSTAH